MKSKLWISEDSKFGVKIITDRVLRQLAFRHHWLKEIDLDGKKFCKI